MTETLEHQIYTKFAIDFYESHLTPEQVQESRDLHLSSLNVEDVGQRSYLEYLIETYRRELEKKYISTVETRRP